MRKVLALGVCGLLAAPLMITATTGNQAAANPVKTDVQAAALPAQSSTPIWLSRVNQLRAWNGMGPARMDSSLQAGVTAHVNYMKKTGEFTHSQDPKSPYYTVEGAQAGMKSNLAYDTTPTWTEYQAVDSFTSAPFHLINIIDPRVDRMAWYMDRPYAALDVLSGMNIRATLPSARVWPQGSGVDTYEYEGFEFPDPAWSCGAKPAAGWGLPLIAQYPTAEFLTQRINHSSIVTKLYENGKEIPVCNVSKSNSQVPQLMYGSVIFVMARQKLKPNSKYTGTVTSNLGTIPIDFTTVRYNGGNPTPTPPPGTPAPKSTVRGDLDGDGRRDTLMVNRNGNLEMLPGLSNGYMGSAKTVGTGWGWVDWIGSPGDMNRDGYQDALFRNKNTGDLMVYFGDGRGGFSSNRRIGTGWYQMDPQKFFAIDKFYANGNRAILSVNAVDCKLYRYDFAADGFTINARTVVGTGWCGMKQVFSNGDNNGDGINDVTAIGRDGKYYVYYGLGNGLTSGRGTQKGSGWAFDKVTAPGDQDGNGYDDVLALTSAGTLLGYFTGPNNSWTRQKMVQMNNWYSKYSVLQ